MTPGDRNRLGGPVRRVGPRPAVLTDLYAYLLGASWPAVVGIAAAGFLLLNAAFAALYWVVPGSLANGDGGLADCFFFSVQTFGAIGYGHLHPRGGWANAVVAAESFVSLFALALLTGLVFAKFARPRSRVLFSARPVVERRDGVPTLSFRVANERGNDIVEASIRVSALMDHVSAEGDRLRRFYDLGLSRASTPIFVLTWQVFHPIDERSPLHGLGPADLAARDVRLVVALTGFDSTFAQTIHARHVYRGDDILRGRRYVDVIRRGPDGGVTVDLRRFHDTEPEPEP